MNEWLGVGTDPKWRRPATTFTNTDPASERNTETPKSSNEIESFRRVGRNHFCFQLTFRSVYLFWLCRISRAITIAILILAQLCGARWWRGGRCCRWLMRIACAWLWVAELRNAEDLLFIIVGIIVIGVPLNWGQHEMDLQTIWY